MNYVEWIRRRIGTRKIFLPFASMIVRDENGRILLQRRTDFDWWGIPGGALELDEDITGCALREVREETGLSAQVERLVGVYSDPKYDVTYPNGDQVQQYTVCLEGRVTGGELRPDGRETVSLRFFSPSALPWDEMPIWYRDMVRDSLEREHPASGSPVRLERVEDQIASVRSHIGQDWYIGVGAAVVIVNPAGSILMVKRSDNGAWSLPAGFSDLGENVAYTAAREAREETGLDVALERILGVFSGTAFHHTYPNGDKVKNVAAVFRAAPVSGQAEIRSSEILEIEWVQPVEVLARTAAKPFSPLFEAVVGCLDSGYFLL